MVQFGNKLLLLRHPPWALYYLDYARLKETLEEERNEQESSVYYLPETHSFDIQILPNLTSVFRHGLDAQIETIVLFLVQEQGDIAHQLQELLLKQRVFPVLSLASETPSLEDTRQLERLSNELYKIAEHLLHLVQFIDLNLTGIRKILKKHDKLTRTRLSAVYLQNDILAPLVHDDTIATLAARLEEAWREQKARLELPLLGHRLGNKKSTTRITASASTGALALPSHQNPVQTMIFLIAAARRQLKQSSEFDIMLAAPMMLPDSSSDSPSEDGDGNQYRPKSRISNILNLMSTFLYMTNYYIVAPTSGNYAEKLGGSVSWSGLIIGMTPVAALVSTVLYSWWTSYSYKSALIFASTCSLIGNLLYAMGLPCNSLALVLVGRLLNGFGSARSINRRYVADTFSKKDRTAASAAFVTAGAMGMASGPAIASALHLTVTSPMNDYWQVENAPGWFMATVWGIYLVCMIRYFEEPPRKHQEFDLPETDVEDMLGEEEPLLRASSLITSTVRMPTAETSNTRIPTAEMEQEDEKEKTLPLWKNIPVMTTFIVYCILKMVLESSLSSASNLTYLYFGWSSSFVGLYLSALGLLMLPANFVVAHLSRNYDDRELILGMLGMMLVGCLAVMKYSDVYTEIQYVVGSVILFVSATALEGPNMSLLSKTIPAKWSKGIFNVGLLATESGTAGRVLADAFMTYCGSFGLEQLLNSMFGSLSLMIGFTIAVAIYFFDHLEPLDMDD